MFRIFSQQFIPRINVTGTDQAILLAAMCMAVAFDVAVASLITSATPP
jgi:hypothetical protein